MTKYNVGWGFTKACNQNCLHCYNASGKKGNDELSLEEAKKVVLKLKENNVQTINYGTGECGLIPEFWDIVEFVNSKGLIQGLTSNGWSVNDKTIDKVKKYMNDIDISIDYGTKEKHNHFRRHPDAWKDAIHALELLNKSEMEFSIVTCIHAKNCSEENISSILALAKKYGCDLRINWFRPTGRGKENSDLKLSVEQFNKALIFLLKNSEIKAVPDSYISAVLGINARKGCPCGSESFRITPTGKVVPCVYFTKELDNFKIQKTEFKKVISSEPFKQINNRDLEFCKDCEYLENCKGGCASRAFLEFGSMNDPDAFCYKKAGIKENPFKDVKFSYKPEGIKVHDNYLCTIILKPL